MHDLHQATMERTEYLRSQGYNMMEIWECAIRRELVNEDYFDNYEMTDPLEPRDALYGGRTNAAKLCHECIEDEKKFLMTSCFITSCMTSCITSCVTSF